MEKITKKEFLETLTENQSTLIWNTRNITAETVANKLENLHLDGVILEKRTATARATFVEFTGGSRLYLNSPGKYEYFKHTGLSGEYISVKHTETLSDGESWTIWTVYLVHKTPEKIALENLYNDLKSGERYGEELHNVRFPCWWWVLSYDPVKRLFRWRHYGQSANRATMEDLKWIISEIFGTTALEFTKTYIKQSASALA